MGSATAQQRHLELVEAIETRFEVARWRGGDVDLWPLASMDLFLDIFDAAGGRTAPPARPFMHRAVAGLATPLTNAWKSRHDRQHFLPRPVPADAIFLGDGVSLDMIDGAWRDRHGEPVMAALEQQGRTCFLMQQGGLDRLPAARPSFAANTIAVRAALGAALGAVLSPGPPAILPDHDDVIAFLRGAGVPAPSLLAARLARRLRTVAAAAAVFQRVLRRVRPRLAFTVTYYAGLGHAFALACRREGVMCVDLQHGAQDGKHRAYMWHRVPLDGYSTLPAMFWRWSAEDAAHIAQWARAPWHGAIHGGDTQLASHYDAPALSADFEREILVALQPVGGHRAIWEKLARGIADAPAGWRWWIRRHPSASLAQDAEYRDLLALRQPNVVIEEACALPLPVLLQRMSTVVSLASGAAVEAAAFGVPALFLHASALSLFPNLIARGKAELVELDGLAARIAALPRRPARPIMEPMPPIAQTLRRLDGLADDYAGVRLSSWRHTAN
jgi:hypothetical protein